MKPILFNTDMVKAILDGRKTVTRRLIKPQPFGYFEVSENPTYLYDFDPPSEKRYPRYQTGDILYVREIWLENEGKYYYMADKPIDKSLRKEFKWHPSIHMPKHAARIFLRVTNVKVERLRNMSITDMISEGINTEGIITTNGPIEYRVINRFEELWNSTVKKSDLDKYSFDANPWVWVIEFERISKEVAYAEGN